MITNNLISFRDPVAEKVRSSTGFFGEETRPSLSINYVGMSKDMGKRLPQLFFALVPIFSTNSRGTACYAGYFPRGLPSSSTLHDHADDQNVTATWIVEVNAGASKRSS